MLQVLTTKSVQSSQAKSFTKYRLAPTHMSASVIRLLSKAILKLASMQNSGAIYRNTQYPSTTAIVTATSTVIIIIIINEY